MFKNRLLLLSTILILLLFTVVKSADAGRKLKVVATLEFLADWAKQIGQKYIDVDFVHDSRLDVHYFQPRPAHVLMCTKADMVIIGGMDLDVWMQALLDASRNRNIQYGRDGYVDASFGIVNILQKPFGRVDMAMGDVHPFGNPHYYYNMDNVGIALENIVTGFAKNDPDNADIYRKNKEEYWQEVKSTFRKLRGLMKPFQGTEIITYHQSWEYFAEEFGLKILDYVEPKPGLPASPKHTKDLIEIINQHQVRIILKEPYYPKRPVKKLMKHTGVQVVELVNFPGGRKNASTYLQNLEANVTELIQAIEK